jgi:aryl-alcohol dehydrogenase-like predicted oxidoreductase
VTAKRISLGCGNFGGIGSAPAFFGKGTTEDDARAIMDVAWNRDIRWFDTADAYGGGRSESYIGRWRVDRGFDPTLTTKVYNPVTGRPR